MTEIVEGLADGLAMGIRSLGSAIFRRDRLARCFEADACFYVHVAKRVEGKFPIEPGVDPGPDLVIEIEITSSASNKLPLFADFGGAEIWRFGGQQVRILRLRGAEYVDSASEIFSGVQADDLTHYITRGIELPRRAWLREVEAWVRTLHN